jgi:hypothetical protein
VEYLEEECSNRPVFNVLCVKYVEYNALKDADELKFEVGGVA